MPVYYNIHLLLQMNTGKTKHLSLFINTYANLLVLQVIRLETFHEMCGSADTNPHSGTAGLLASETNTGRGLNRRLRGPETCLQNK